jgi:hypothetical protein
MDIEEVGHSPEDIDLESHLAFPELGILEVITGTAGQGNSVRVDSSIGVDNSAEVDNLLAFIIQDSLESIN